MEQLAAAAQRARSAICSDDKQRNRYGAESRRSAAVQPVDRETGRSESK